MADNLKGIPFSSDDEGIDFITRAKLLVQEQINLSGIGTRRGDTIQYISLDEIYVVWFAFVLGNWKALISTSRPDGRIWEVTHNKQKGESYVDTYLKTHNVIAVTTQAAYDAGHDHSDLHCLSDPCSWHPGEQRIRPRPAYPATLATESAETVTD